MIAMADGTEKPIEDIKPGDLIKSWNPVTKTFTAAVAIVSQRTGANRDFTAYNFEDGRALVAFGTHFIYDTVEGSYIDIQAINRNRKVLNIDGNAVSWAGKRGVHYHGKRKKRYNLISSNNLYFANGILAANTPSNKLEYIEDWGKGILEPEIRTVWEQDCDDYNTITAVTGDLAVYEELRDVYGAYTEAQHQINLNKKKLNDSDYKAHKRIELSLPDEEWETFKKDRQDWRDKINENEAKLAQAHQQIEATWEAHKPTGWSRRALFEKCCVRDNAIFDLVRAYFHTDK